MLHGEHKIQRGYLPVETHSAHWIADHSFRDAVAEFLQRETRVMEHEIAELSETGPFRQTEEQAASRLRISRTPGDSCE